MPRHGWLILSDVRGPTLTIVFAPCGRRSCYSIKQLMAEYGDAKLTELLETLASCPKRARPTSMIAARPCTRGSRRPFLAGLPLSALA
jgi:hypothetical protein